MSIKLMSQVWERQLDHPEQSILLAMADHANDEGEHVFPGVDRIAWKTGYEERQVRRIGKKLKEMGVLIQTGAPSRTRATEYRINLDALPLKKPFVKRPISVDKMSGDTECPPIDDRTFCPPLETDDRTFSTLSPDIAMSEQPSIQPSIREPSNLSTHCRVLPGGKPPSAKKKKTASPKDPRRSHHSIGLIQSITSHWPKKAFWDRIIKLGDPDGSGRNRLDPEKMTDLMIIASSVGIYEGNLAVWLFDWYVNGVPDRWRGQEITSHLAAKYRKGANGKVQNRGTAGSGSDAGPEPEFKSRLRKPINS